jgi:CTP synthase (UTP-ammonia lyase)
VLAGIEDARHEEYGDGAGTPVVSLLACSLAGVEIEVELQAGTMVRGLYGDAAVAREQTTCNYGLEPEHQQIASEHGMRVAAIDDTGEVRAVERTDHPFFVATLYQPQLTSEPGRPHPVFSGFVEAVRAAGGLG